MLKNHAVCFGLNYIIRYQPPPPPPQPPPPLLPPPKDEPPPDELDGGELADEMAPLKDEAKEELKLLFLLML